MSEKPRVVLYPPHHHQQPHFQPKSRQEDTGGEQMPLICISYFFFAALIPAVRWRRRTPLVGSAAAYWGQSLLVQRAGPLSQKNAAAIVHELLMKEPIRRVPLTHQLHNYQLKAARLAAALQRRANQSITSQRVIHIHGHIPLPLLAKTLTTNAL